MCIRDSTNTQNAFPFRQKFYMIKRSGAGANNISVDAVSYTHLDVYKRQTGSGASLLPRSRMSLLFLAKSGETTAVKDVS